MRHQDGTSEQIIGRIATRQHGAVARAQLLDAGVTPAEIRHRLRSGALLRVHPGVYRVGHRAPSVEASFMSAVLACGPGALLAGLSAAHLWGLVRHPPPDPEVLAASARRIRGIEVRRMRHPAPLDRAACRGIPVTTVARTLVDLAALLDAEQLARACHEAEVRYRIAPRAVEDVLARRPASPGGRDLRRVLHGDVHVTLSHLERCFLRLLRDAGLPLPRTNRRVGARRVDCWWPESRLVVELDGYRYHASRHAWEQDRRREREARARGDEFRRYTFGDVLEHPGPMLRELAGILARPILVSRDDTRMGRVRARRGSSPGRR